MPIKDQGILGDRYTLVPRTLIFLTHNNYILLQKGSSNKKIWAGLYNGIGGHVEPGEDILASAKRELAEEAGITQVDLDLKGIITIDINEKNGIIIFVFHGVPGNTAIRPNHEGTLKWHTINEVPNLPLVEDIPNLLTKVIVAHPLNKLFYAHYTYDNCGNLVTKFS